MSELPRGWVETRLEDITDVISGQSPEGARINEVRFGLPFYQGKAEFGEDFPRPRKWCDSPERIARKGSVLLSIRAPVGPTNFANEESGIGRGLASINGLGGISNRFVRRVLKHVEPALKAKATGTTFEAITSKVLKLQEIPLPPLAEQNRIVAKLDALNTKSACARTELARIETLVSRYKQAVLSKAFCGELTKEWRLAKGTEAWLSAKPDDLFRWSSGKNLPSREYAGGSVPVIGGNGVSGYHNKANTEESTIVIGRVGALCGNVYLSDGPAWITDNAIYAKWRSPAVDLRFAVLVYEVADLNKMSGGTGQPYVNQSILNSIDFPLPNITEQREIVRRVESAFAKIDRLAKEAKRALELVDRLDEAILAKAFRGELVPQDENDEPAEHLLARIRAERGAAPKGKRGRGAKG